MERSIEAAVTEKLDVLRAEIEHWNEALVRQIRYMKEMLDGRKGKRKSNIEWTIFFVK